MDIINQFKLLLVGVGIFGVGVVIYIFHIQPISALESEVEKLTLTNKKLVVDVNNKMIELKTLKNKSENNIATCKQEGLQHTLDLGLINIDERDKDENISNIIGNHTINL